MTQRLLQVGTKFRQLSPHFGGRESHVQLPTSRDVTGSRKFKMAATRPDIVVYLLAW